MKANRRVMYLRDEKYNPVGCVAVSLTKNRQTVRYQLSVVNPVDKFERSLARHIALGRLLEKPIRLSGFDGKQSNHVIINAVMASILSSKTTPARAKKAAKLWLQCNSLITVRV